MIRIWIGAAMVVLLAGLAAANTASVNANRAGAPANNISDNMIGIGPVIAALNAEAGGDFGNCCHGMIAVVVGGEDPGTTCCPAIVAPYIHGLQGITPPHGPPEPGSCVGCVP